MVIRPKVHGFLDRELPGLLGVVGTNSEDGFPHLVPVWYHWDGARIHIWTHESRIWVRNLARDPSAGFSVQEPAEPYAAVTMRGSARIAIWDDEQVSAEIDRITRRYVPGLDVAGYIQAWRGLCTIVSITPESVVYRSD